MTINTQELRSIGRAYEPVSHSLSRAIVDAADTIDLQTAQLAAQAAEIARLREIVEMAAAGNTEYDVLQRRARATLQEKSNG